MFVRIVAYVCLSEVIFSLMDPVPRQYFRIGETGSDIWTTTVPVSLCTFLKLNTIQIRCKINMVCISLESLKKHFSQRKVIPTCGVDVLMPRWESGAAGLVLGIRVARYEPEPEDDKKLKEEAPGDKKYLRYTKFSIWKRIRKLLLSLCQVKFDKKNTSL